MDLPDRAARDFVVGNVTPPDVYDISMRTRVDDQMIVVSVVEVWTWRIILRGPIANIDAPPTPDPSEPGVRRFDSGGFRRWMKDWQASDDIGTEYRSTSGGAGGPGGDWWADFDVRFEPAPPAEARRLSLRGPGGLEIDIDLPTNR